MQRWDVVRAGHQGDLATARAALTDSDSRVRASGLDALARLGALDPASVRDALRDPHNEVRLRAAWLAAREHLGPMGAGEISDDLMALLDESAVEVVEMAAFALGERSHVPAVGRLAQMARTHDDALCREAAVAALGSIGDEAGLPAVLDSLGDVATVRRRAVIALAAFEGPEVDAALQAARQDRDAQVRQSAEDLTADSD